MIGMIKKSIEKYNENLKKICVEDYAKRIGYLTRGKMSVGKIIMTHAHRVRKFAAEKYDCKASEISFSECLKMSWEALRAWKAINTKPHNRDGYVEFSNRNRQSNGDRLTWVKVSVETITVKRSENEVSPAYAAEIQDYCKGFGVDFDSIPCGGSVSVFC